jgi:hypothetical protein
MCNVVGCKTSKSFNFFGLKAEYCGTHKLEGMINTKHEVCDECCNQASYGFITNNLRIKCSSHRTTEMINLKTKNIKCLDDLCNNNFIRYNEYCSIKCYLSNTSPENTKQEDLKHISSKEYLVYRFLQKSYVDKNIKWNKQINGTLYRPDFIINFGKYQILIEVDENQHLFYNKNSEICRIEEIQRCLNMPLYVIRFNPDKYIINDEVLTTELVNRLDALKECIDNCSNKDVCEKYEIEYLFYNK